MRNSITPKLFYLFIFFCFSTDLGAQQFEKLNGPYGGGSRVYEGRNGILFQILTDLNGKYVLYKSLNGGSSWTRITTIPPASNTEPLSVGLDGNLYCTVNEKLYKSTNDGQSWVLLNYPSNAFIRSVTALPDGTILMADYFRIFQSSDNGQTWQQSSISSIESFFYNPIRDETFAISEEFLYISKDKGLSWNIFYQADFGYDKRDLQFAANGIVLVSGQEFIWKLDSTGSLINLLDPFPGAHWEVHMVLSKTGRLFAFKGHKCFYSDNLGNTWIEFGAANTNKKALHSFSGSSNGNLFGVKLSGGLYRSVDNGKSWYFSSHGLNYAHVVEVDFISDTKIVALTDDGLFYSEDSGQDWYFLKEVYYEYIYSSEASQVVTFGDEIYFANNDTIFYFKDWKSTPTVLLTLNNIYPDNKLFMNQTTGILFRTNLGELYRSEDKGLHWTKLPLNDILDVLGFPDGSVISLTTDAVYKSLDKGDHWTQIFKDNSVPFGWFGKILTNTFSSAYTLYEGTDNLKLTASHDLGASWNVTDIISQNGNNLDPFFGQVANNIDHIFVTGFTGEIFKSINFGRDFSLFTREFDNIQGLAISPNQKLYVMTDAYGLYRSKISTSSSKVLRGNVFEDQNVDCIKIATDKNLTNRLVVADNGIHKLYGYSNSIGNFSVPLESGSYNLSVDLDNNFWTSCDKSIVVASYNFNDTLYLGLKVNRLCPFLKVDLQSSILRRCFKSTIFVEYSNTGTTTAQDAYIDVTMDSLLEYVSSSIPFSSQNGNVYRFLLGDVDENNSGYFSIDVNVSCNAALGELHCVEAHIYPDTSCIQSSVAQIKTSAECLGDSIRLIIKNIGSADMTAAQNWFAIDESVSSTKIVTFASGPFFLTAGQEFSVIVASRPRILFQAQQDQSYPFNKVSSTQIISCAASPQPGAASFRILQLDEEEPYIAKFCERNRGSFDPNDITGYPSGITDKKFIDKNQQLDYVIRFQNTGTDTAFTVRIENPIPTNELDLTTLSLGASSHPYQFTLDPKGKLIFTFSNIILPDSNINEKLSHGFIQYCIKPVDQLSSGTKVLNDAEIFFDYNDGVKTNREFHTIGYPVTVRLVENDDEQINLFEISPNPMIQSSGISLHPVLKDSRYSLSCLDANQREIRNESFSGNLYLLERKELPSGVYFLILNNAQGIPLAMKKLIIK